MGDEDGDDGGGEVMNGWMKAIEGESKSGIEMIKEDGIDGRDGMDERNGMDGKDAMDGRDGMDGGDEDWVEYDLSHDTFLDFYNSLKDGR